MSPLNQVPNCHIHLSFVHEVGWFHIQAWCVCRTLLGRAGPRNEAGAVKGGGSATGHSCSSLWALSVKPLETMTHVTGSHGTLKLLRDTFILVCPVMKP